MTKTKLNYRFHNPNTAESTADYIVKIFIDANQGKVEQVIQSATDTIPNYEQNSEGHSA